MVVARAVPRKTPIYFIIAIVDVFILIGIVVSDMIVAILGRALPM